MDLMILFLKFLEVIVTSINVAGILIIIWGFVVSAFSFIRLKLQIPGGEDFIINASKLRAILGTYILMGLEFMIASDIIHTFIQPSQEDLIVLATIVGIRTVISYFLDRTVAEAESLKKRK